MKLDTLLDRLFPLGHRVQVDNQVLHGHAETAEGAVTVIGTTDDIEIGVEHALMLANTVLESTRVHPKQAILMLVDTAGQRLTRRDELLGINGYLGHLAQCLDQARQRGAHLIALVYNEAVSGGFLSFGLMADGIYALANAQVRVMDLGAISRVLKQPLERLEKLTQVSPVFAPGIDNYITMGAVQSLWDGDLSEHLLTALRNPKTGDQRRKLGLERGGRLFAFNIADKVSRGVA